MMWFLLGINVSGVILLIDAVKRGQESSLYVVSRWVVEKWEKRR